MSRCSRFLLLCLAFLGATATVQAQADSSGKVKITTSIDPATVQPNSSATMIVNVSVDLLWHIYSVLPNEFSTPTDIKIDTPNVEIAGPIVEPKPHEHDLGGDIKTLIHEGDVEFRVPLKIGAVPDGNLRVKGTILVQACDASGCLMSATIPIGATAIVSSKAGGAASGGNETKPAVTQEVAEALARIERSLSELYGRTELIENLVKPPEPEEIPTKPEWSLGDVKLTFQKTALRAGETVDLTLEFTTPEDAKIVGAEDIFVDFVEENRDAGIAASRIKNVEALSATSSADGKKHTVRLRLEAKELARSGKHEATFEVTVPMSIKGAEFEWRTEPQKVALDFGLPSIWKWALKAILAALLALLTPCVFPMIPVTVSFFTKQAEKQQTHPLKMPTLYFLGIVVSFVLIGVLFTIALGTKGAQLLATNGWLQLSFGILFVVFAFSLFGAFTLAPPAWLMAKAGTVRGKGGVLGTLGMGLLFSLTSFACTAPLVGTLLVDAAESREWQMPIIGMFAFSAVLGLPFFFLAMFPKLLSSMPKSGGWMSMVKVTLGFMELAFALKFVGAADAYFLLGIFTRTSILWMWVVIFALNGLYLLGIFQFGHDEKPSRIGPFQATIAVLLLLLAGHMIKGTEGLRMPTVLESLLPPDLSHQAGEGALGWANRIENDLEKAVARAKEEKAPLFIDFTGYT